MGYQIFSFGCIRYCEYNVCWEFYRHHMCSLPSLSVLLLVLLQHTISIVENTIPYICPSIAVLGSGVVLECLPFQRIFLCRPPLCAFSHSGRPMDCFTRISLCRSDKQ
nr:Dol-P-Man:Man(5)GlcNAc(2)-PP-Dol alpha-1,3-mannosyltransferase [Ipomoea batatas]